MPLGPHLPDLTALSLLVDVARLGSIGAAARAHGMSQQAASERLRSVEAQVGVGLLHRGARGSTLTEPGRVLVEQAARLLDVAEEVDAVIGMLRDVRGRELRIAASMTIAEHVLPRWLVALRRRQAAECQTETTVSLVATNSTHVVEAVRDGDADLGFVEGSTTPTGLASLAVDADELVLVAAPDDPVAGRTLAPADVAALELTGREHGSGTREVIEQAFAGHGLTARPPGVELASSTAVLAAVRAGSAPAFLSRRIVALDVEAGHLVVVPTPGLDLRRTFRAVWVGTSTPPAGPVRDLLALARR